MSTTEAAVDRREEMRRRCIEFHRRRPIVWTMFCQFARERRARGFRHYSAREIWERLRWELRAPAEAEEAFGLNDHYPPFYARAFMRLYPDFVGFFELRKQVSQGRRPRGAPDRPMPTLDADEELSERDEWPTTS